MAIYRKKRWYFDLWNDVLLDARGLPVKQVDFTRNDVYQVELQVFNGGQFAVNSVGLIGSGIAEDLTSYTNIVAGIKTSAQYAADGDFTLATAGFDLTNSVHSPLNGRVAMLNLWPSTPADYYGEVEMLTGAGNPLTVFNEPTIWRLNRDVIIGNEASMPSGVTASVYGNVSISNAATDSGAITVAGMASTGQVILGFLAPTGTPTVPFYWVTYSSGSFTINVDVAPGAGNAYNFRWTMVRLS